MQKTGKKIILSGGGTGGSVTPLLAMREIIVNSEPRIADCQFVWIGTKTGPERALVESAGIEFVAISSGKFRRYLAWQNFADIFRVLFGFLQSVYFVIREKPDLVLSAGSFVSVPLVWAAWLFRVPALLLQMDVRPGLANRMMAPFARKVLVVFEKSLADFGSKAVLAGIPVRPEFRTVKVSRREALQKIGLGQDLPVVLVIGGGTGATAINDCIIQNIGQLTKFCQILHVTGPGKATAEMQSAREQYRNYKYFEFLDTFGVIKAFAAADVIISRAGMGVLAELCFVAKPAIIIPLPESHQEENADVFARAGAAIVLAQADLSGEMLSENLRNILRNRDLNEKLRHNIHNLIRTDCEAIITKEIGSLL